MLRLSAMKQAGAKRGNERTQNDYSTQRKSSGKGVAENREFGCRLQDRRTRMQKRPSIGPHDGEVRSALVPNYFPDFRMYSITPHTLEYIQIPWVQDGLLPPSQSSSCVPYDPPSCSKPSSMLPSYPEHFISSSLAAQKPVSQTCSHERPMPRRPSTSRVAILTLSASLWEGRNSQP